MIYAKFRLIPTVNDKALAFSVSKSVILRKIDFSKTLYKNIHNRKIYHSISLKFYYQVWESIPYIHAEFREDWSTDKNVMTVSNQVVSENQNPPGRYVASASSSVARCFPSATFFRLFFSFPLQTHSDFVSLFSSFLLRCSNV